MKKRLSILLIIVIILTMSIPVFAESGADAVTGASEPWEDEATEDYVPVEGSAPVVNTKPVLNGQDTYTVMTGDTLAQIAMSAGITVNEIGLLNPHITDVNWIYPGDVIILSGDVTTPEDEVLMGDADAITISQIITAAHGDHCFTVTSVMTANDLVVDVVIDEYQFIDYDGTVAVPNSFETFGENSEGNLASKRLNSDIYSNSMAIKAGSTVKLEDNYASIEAHAIGKTVVELQTMLSNVSAEEMVDSITGATLVDSYNYLQSIVDAVTMGEQVTFAYDGDLAEIMLMKADGAPHGHYAYGLAVVAVADETVVGALIDEYQYLNKNDYENFVPVPNSDGDFGTHYVDADVQLASKRINAVGYSAGMATKAGSTVVLDDNYDAIQDYAAGKTIAELETILSMVSAEEMVDSITGATLADSYNYIKFITDTAKGVESSEMVTLKQIQAAPHGHYSFANVTVLMSGDQIVDSYIDEFQFMDEGSIGVPNSDADFGTNVIEGKVLASKKVNSETYSATMAEKAGSTVMIADNFAAIEDFANGMTVDMLEQFLATSETPVDSVTGATLADTGAYLEAVLAAAKSEGGMNFSYTGELADISIVQEYLAPHGHYSFAVITNAMANDVVVGAYIDEYQFMDEGSIGVPNTDLDFGTNVVEGKVLGSKRVNTEGYSAGMATKAGSTVMIDQNFDYIQYYVAGMTTVELQAELMINADTPEVMVDAVSGATLADSYGYLNAIYEVAN